MSAEVLNRVWRYCNVEIIGGSSAYRRILEIHRKSAMIGRAKFMNRFDKCASMVRINFRMNTMT